MTMHVDPAVLYRQAMSLLVNMKGCGMSGAQASRLHQLASTRAVSTLERQWALSLGQAMVGGYFVGDHELHQLTELVSIDNEGYLYFDGIRGDNVGDGVNLALGNYAKQASAFEGECMSALLSGRTVQQRFMQ